MKLVLRPHHLLCTTGYSGKGYDSDFIDKMDYVTNVLRENEEVEIKIVFGTDEICEACPRKMAEDVCMDDDKVLRIDRKVVEHFGIEEKSYSYKNLFTYIKDNMTDEIFEDICKHCQWKNISECRSRLVQ